MMRAVPTRPDTRKARALARMPTAAALLVATLGIPSAAHGQNVEIRTTQVAPSIYML